MIKNLPSEIQVVTNHRCLLGEGPVWDANQNAIIWLDIISGQIHEYNVLSEQLRTIEVGQMIGCLAVTTAGNFIAGLKDGIGFVDRSSGNVKIIAAPEKHLQGNRFNDGKCDPAGRFWAGTMALTEQESAGSLYMLDHDRSIQKKKTGVTISNGLAWSVDRKTLYYVDTPTSKVTAFNFDISTGMINKERIVINIPKEEGSPDGMTIDNQGMLWIAHWDGWQISRWDPESGRKIGHVQLPVAKVTSCTFGGSNLTDLYITTAKVDLSEQELAMQPLAGSLFVIRDCGFKGLPAYEFQL